MTTAWAHLLNAQHIDWVLADLKARLAVWDAAALNAAWHAAQNAAWHAAQNAAWHAAQNAARNAAWDAARGTARAAARAAAWDAARGAAWDAARDAAWAEARAAARDAARGAALDAVGALIAYDGCALLLDCSLEHLQRLYRLNPHPSFLLLQPAVIAKNTP